MYRKLTIDLESKYDLQCREECVVGLGVSLAFGSTLRNTTLHRAIGDNKKPTNSFIIRLFKEIYYRLKRSPNWVTDMRYFVTADVLARAHAPYIPMQRRPVLKSLIGKPG